MLKLDDIKQLINQSDDRIFSLYLNVDNSLRENQADNPAWRIHAKNALSEAEKSISEDDQPVWEDIQERVTRYLDNYSPSGRGLVLFYGTDVDSVYELPVPPTQNESKFGEILIAPLLWLVDEFEQYLIVLVDREEAQFLTTYLGNIDRKEALASDRFTFEFGEKTIMPRPTGTQGDVGAAVTAGSNRDQFEDKEDEYVARFHLAERKRFTAYHHRWR